ncbi:MAG: hypothetical protein J6W96_00970 [Alphaproteobacteria bacterium]|nr:hypothetical protein [Alphaproteobacteria bacterium]
MKYTLTITDMNDEEFARVANAFNITPCVEVSKNDIVLTDEPIVPVEEPVLHGPAYDKNGLPWDERIHSSNHKMTDKGVWQRRRGITDIEFERVKNELLGVQAPVTPVTPVAVEPQEVVTPVAPAPTAPVAPISPVVAPTQLVVDNQFVPQVVAPDIYAQPVAQPQASIAPVAPQAPQPVTAQPDVTVLFKTMFDKVKAGMAAGAVKANDVRDLITAVNTQFGTQYQTLAAINDNVAALQFVINNLVNKGL